MMYIYHTTGYPGLITRVYLFIRGSLFGIQVFRILHYKTKTKTFKRYRTLFSCGDYAMNGKDSKVPIYIAILVAVILIAAGGYFVMGGQSKLSSSKETPVTTPQKTVETAKTALETAKETPAKTGQASVETPVVAAPARVETIKCELCHKNPQTLSPHVNGGKLCINCHGSQVHNIHIGPGTVSLNCDTCHGFPPKIPTVEKGEGPGSYSVCERCHAAPPDSLKPSNGDLIVVHLSRAKYCTNCHGTDIGAIHMAAIGNATKK